MLLCNKNGYSYVIIKGEERYPNDIWDSVGYGI